MSRESRVPATKELKTALANMGGAFEGVFASPAKVAKSELFGTANKYREKDAAKTSKPNSKPEATKPELKPEPSRAQGGRRSKDDNGKKKTRKDRDIDKKAAEQESRQKAKRRKVRRPPAVALP